MLYATFSAVCLIASLSFVLLFLRWHAEQTASLLNRIQAPHIEVAKQIVPEYALPLSDEDEWRKEQEEIARQTGLPPLP